MPQAAISAMQRRTRRLGAACWVVASALIFGPAAAASSMTLAAEASLADTGLVGYITPRFALKKGIRVEVRAGDAPFLRELARSHGADALLIESAQARVFEEAGLGSATPPAFEDRQDGRSFAVLVVRGATNEGQARAFVQWLNSDVAARTLAAFSGDGPLRFEALARTSEEAVVAVPEGDPVKGERLALLHCGRCHVVNETNRMGGIGSTPSFAALRTIEDWERRFLGFYALNPHPSFTQVPGLTEPFDPARPPHIAPVEMSAGDLDAILAYAATIPPADLGAELELR